MKRDMDLVRDLMVWMEDQDRTMILLQEFPILQDDRQKTIGHIMMLESAGFLLKSEKGAYQISWDGHEFLDKVRDPEIWSKTKEGAKSVGSWSVKLLGDLAAGFIRMKATELGLPLA